VFFLGREEDERLAIEYPWPGRGGGSQNDMSDGPEERVSMLPAQAGAGAADAATVQIGDVRVGEVAVDPKRTEAFWRDARRRRMLAVADACTAVVGTLVATGLGFASWGFLFVPIWILIAKLLGLYDRDHRAVRHLTLDEIPSIFAWAGLSVAVLGLLVPLTPAPSITVGAAVFAALVAGMCGSLLRASARSLYRRVTPRERTAVIGDDKLTRAARRKVELFPDMHLELAGGMRIESTASDQEISRVRELSSRVDRIIVASASVDSHWVDELVTICREAQVKLSVVSPLLGQASAPPVRLTEVADLPLLEYDTWAVSRSTMLIKRTFDIAVSSAAMIILLPLFPLVAMAIKLDSRGPVLFRQRRAGLAGRPFQVFKLRTMHRDAEDQLATLVDLDALEEPVFKLRYDPRVTRLGRFLRRFSIDELPQLVNVLRGEMSLVGPRPEVYTIVKRYRPEHYVRFAARPGMTGPMQIFGRGALALGERLAVEIDYIDNLSLGRDLRIIGQTIPVIIRGTGAY
jgi:exopolysaccharide biosynthesis polyprenyl glycosylphosphotransferase